MFQVSGFFDPCTLSVDREILAKSVMNTTRIIPSAEMTNLPVRRKINTTKDALKTVLLILLMTHVVIRW